MKQILRRGARFARYYFKLHMASLSHVVSVLPGPGRAGAGPGTPPQPGP
jgi:hypothetical protein